MTKLTKRQVIRELQRRGWRITADNGRTIDVFSPEGETGRFEPRELLAELERPVKNKSGKVWKEC